MVRDARRCRAPHHEGLWTVPECDISDLILRSIAKRCVSKDEVTGAARRSPYPALPRPFFSAARRKASASAPPCSCDLRGADDVIDAFEISRGLPSAIL